MLLPPKFGAVTTYMLGHPYELLRTGETVFYNHISFCCLLRPSTRSPNPERPSSRCSDAHLKVA